MNSATVSVIVLYPSVSGSCRISSIFRFIVRMPGESTTDINFFNSSDAVGRLFRGLTYSNIFIYGSF